MKYKGKDIKDYTDVELMINKYNLAKETYNAVDRGHYYSAKSYIETLAKIDEEMKKRDRK